MIVKFLSFFPRKKNAANFQKTCAAQNDSEMGKMDAKISKKQLAKIAKINQAKIKMKAAYCVDLAICPSKCKYTARFF